MPSNPAYFIRAGLPVYTVPAVHVNVRNSKPKDIYFILHDTDGRDSRQELYDSPRKVSVHYLVGEYLNVSGPCVIKYMSEVKNYANGAGFGSAGGVPTGFNPVSVQFEIEYVGMNNSTLDAYAATIGQSMRIWREFGSNVILIPHRMIDSRKRDPRFDWNSITKKVYEYSFQL